MIKKLKIHKMRDTAFTKTKAEKNFKEFFLILIENCSEMKGKLESKCRGGVLIYSTITNMKS